MDIDENKAKIAHVLELTDAIGAQILSLMYQNQLKKWCGVVVKSLCIMSAYEY